MKRMSRASIILASDMHMKIPNKEHKRTILVFSVMKNKVAQTRAAPIKNETDVQGIYLSILLANLQ